jgi:hypothetical protein
VICKYYTILYKGLEHLQIWVMGVPGTNNSQMPRGNFIVTMKTLWRSQEWKQGAKQEAIIMVQAKDGMV